MTNYEWLIANEKEIVKDILAEHSGKHKGKIYRCSDTDCSDCDFKRSLNNNQPCRKTTEEWLEAEYEPLYKKGDVVIIKNEASIWIFVRETNCGNAILTRNVLDVDVEIGLDFNVKIDDIEKKVGNIYD